MYVETELLLEDYSESVLVIETIYKKIFTVKNAILEDIIHFACSNHNNDMEANFNHPTQLCDENDLQNYTRKMSHILFKRGL